MQKSFKSLCPSLQKTLPRVSPQRPISPKPPLYKSLRFPTATSITLKSAFRHLTFRRNVTKRMPGRRPMVIYRNPGGTLENHWNSVWNPKDHCRHRKALKAGPSRPNGGQRCQNWAKKLHFGSPKNDIFRGSGRESSGAKTIYLLELQCRA